MVDEMRDKVVAEMKFNAKYLKEKYGLDSILILATETSDDYTTRFEATQGNTYIYALNYADNSA